MFLGHVGGLLIPESWTKAAGITGTDIPRQAFAAWALCRARDTGRHPDLIYRRRTTGPVFSATTRNDKGMYVLLVATLVAGLATTVLGNLTGHPHDYRLTVSPWFRLCSSSNPTSTPWPAAGSASQIHVMLAWALFAAWPFTRLVHVFSAPLGYLTRPYIVYRSRDTARLGARAAAPGWERASGSNATRDH